MSEMIKQYQRFDNQRIELNEVALLKDVAAFLAKQRKRFESMQRTTQKTLKAFENLKHRQASHRDDHLAREQAESAAEQSRSIMVFTIFTVIFLPLFSCRSSLGWIRGVERFRYRIPITACDLRLHDLDIARRHPDRSLESF